MKKQMNSKSKRKWITGGLAAFASIALLTTGFAVWTVGTSKTTTDSNITIKVDTAKNKNVSITAELSDSSISLSEKYTGTTESVVKNENGSETDLSITFSSIVLSYPSDSGDTKYNGLSFSFKEIGTTDISGDAAVTSMPTGTKQLIDGNYSETNDKKRGTSFEYITFPTAITYTNAATTGDQTGSNPTVEISNNVTTVTYTALTVKFGWGDFFGKVSPCTYYNSLTWTKGFSSADASAITAELNAMHGALDGKTIVMKVTMTYDENDKTFSTTSATNA